MDTDKVDSVAFDIAVRAFGYIRHIAAYHDLLAAAYSAGHGPPAGRVPAGLSGQPVATSAFVPMPVVGEKRHRGSFFYRQQPLSHMQAPQNVDANGAQHLSLVPEDTALVCSRSARPRKVLNSETPSSPRRCGTLSPRSGAELPPFFLQSAGLAKSDSTAKTADASPGHPFPLPCTPDASKDVEHEVSPDTSQQADAGAPASRRAMCSSKLGQRKASGGINGLLKAIDLLDAEVAPGKASCSIDVDSSGANGSCSGGLRRQLSEGVSNSPGVSQPWLRKPSIARNGSPTTEYSRDMADDGAMSSDCSSISEGCLKKRPRAHRPAGQRQGPLRRGDSVRLGKWTKQEKTDLIRIVGETRPCGASDWEAVAARLGPCSRGGASAERMFRTLTDPRYQRATNKHGRRINSRRTTPMHVMAAAALRQLPGKAGNLTQIADLIKAHPEFSKDLDESIRPGTKSYPRWKDALVGCFKVGRYPHLVKANRKSNGLNVYLLREDLMPAAGPHSKPATPHQSSEQVMRAPFSQDASPTSSN